MSIDLDEIVLDFKEIPILNPTEVQTILKDDLLQGNLAHEKFNLQDTTPMEECSTGKNDFEVPCAAGKTYTSREKMASAFDNEEANSCEAPYMHDREPIVGRKCAEDCFGHPSLNPKHSSSNRIRQVSPTSIIAVASIEKCTMTASVASKNVAKKKKKVMLDDFLWALLEDETYISCIQWTLKERLEFKFTRPEMVAKLWGDFKKKKRMNYEKLSRGLRYYYHSKKLERIQHKHYHFRFLKTKENEHIEINLKGDKGDND